MDERPENSPAQVDLSADSCAVVPDGGSVNVTLGGFTRTLALPTGRDWLLAATSVAEGVVLTNVNEDIDGLIDFAIDQRWRTATGS